MVPKCTLFKMMMDKLNWHTLSAGLDYPGIGPEHSYYNDIGRVSYVSATDNEAMEALITFSKLKVSFQQLKVHMH